MKKSVFMLVVFFTLLASTTAFTQTEMDVLARYYDNYPNSKYWYQGTVSRQSGSDYYVEYADGDRKWHTDRGTIVPFISVQQTGANIGDKVLARYYDSGYKSKFWYKGKITRKDSDGKFYVEYEDGDRKWHGNHSTLVLFRTL
jgi:Agenet domain